MYRYVLVWLNPEPIQEAKPQMQRAADGLPVQEPVRAVHEPAEVEGGALLLLLSVPSLNAKLWQCGEGTEPCATQPALLTRP